MAEKEYIEREALKSKLKNMEATSPNKAYQNAMEDMIYYFIPKIIDEFPAADVVPVVRCKECKHYQNHPNGLCYLHTEPYGDGYKGDAVCVEPNGFCSYGERKELDNGGK